MSALTLPTQIATLQRTMLALPPEQRIPELEVRHHFPPGLYGRELHIPEGVVLVGKTHRHAHRCWLQSGTIRVVCALHGARTLEGPLYFDSAAGTKRVIYALEDTVMVTYHANPTNTTDLAIIEAEHIIEEQT